MPQTDVVEATPEAPPVTEPIGQPTTPVGPTPAKTRVGDKFREELARIETERNQEPKPEVTPEPEKPTETPKPEEKPAEEPKPETKPFSPLDAVLEKPSKEEKPAIDADSVISDLEKIEVPKSEHWKRARETMRTQAEELKALKTSPKPAADESVWVKKTEELQAALNEREQTIKAINAEYSTEYQTMLQDRAKDIHKLSNRAKSLGIESDIFVEALSMPYGKARTDLIKGAMAELDTDDKVLVRGLIDKIEDHDEKITDFRKDLPKKYDEIVEAQQRQAAEQQANNLKQLETEFVKISELLPEATVTLRQVPDDVPGGTEWNKEIAEARATALRVLKPDQSDFNETVSIAMKGARYDTLEKRYLALHKDYSALKKNYSDQDGSSPDFKGTPKPTTKVAKTPGVKYREALAQRQAAGDMDQ